MPKAPKPTGPGPDPSQSGTGQGALTEQQQRMLADLWFYLQDDRVAKEYFAQVERMRQMDPKDRAWMQQNLNNADPKELWARLQQKYSANHAPGGGYNFPEPKDNWDGERGTSGFEGWTPPSQNPYDGHGWDNPPDATKVAPNPPGYRDQQPGFGRDGKVHPASAVAPAVAAVAASLYTRMKLLGNPSANIHLAGRSSSTDGPVDLNQPLPKDRVPGISGSITIFGHKFTEPGKVASEDWLRAYREAEAEWKQELQAKQREFVKRAQAAERGEPIAPQGWRGWFYNGPMFKDEPHPTPPVKSNNVAAPAPGPNANPAPAVHVNQQI